MKTPAALALGVIAAVVSAAPADAQSASPRGASACAVHAPEAASRARLPVDVVLRVMRAESAGNPRAVSHKGAMGCMQIMPGTWADLTRRHGLGRDPFDPRMNMIGGALYLAEMVARFGLPGAYSAYNAGPGRYQRHIANDVPLPRETIAYTARVTGAAPSRGAVPAAPRWQDAGLFMAQSDVPRSSPARVGNDGDRTAHSRHDATAHSSGVLFPLAGPVRDASEPGRAGIGTEP
ncbi:Lytic transglycosylase, catalytic [Rhizorhabdus wittichii RW1]|uniref:Lytic transglycosylase, catalytic n=1 Tax=Rhizorhabdus wittichii (strain DSM 6014 / CCUG 31198 / JCM 15750 / NBRC 105917 / EY 4224 / RW1) TaxID=392499 RepID=A0A9J9H7X9_RHIWR|nr:Lytic transglycosylase, catalytic [Rhizorhabdus wittichii RW1]